MAKRSDYSIADRRTIDKIMTVKQWNAECRPEEKIAVKYGYVMPIYHGYQWEATKQALINMFCFSPIK